MVHYRLRLQAPETITPEEAASSFYWLPSGQSSFSPGLEPSLAALGNVPALNVDAVRLASAVYAADRSTPRKAGDSDWNQREIEVAVPVSDATIWQANAEEMERVVNFLTGDLWRFEFVAEEQQFQETALDVETAAPSRVVLLSGGADSAVGALVSRAEMASNEHHQLVSHFSAKFLAPIQRDVAAELARLVPGPGQIHRAFHLSRRSTRLDGKKYANEYSTRSRSLLFLTLGLAVSANDRVPLWIPENGYASLNVPLGPERRGSLSTRTTHPAFLSGLTTVLQKVGAHSEIVNPFASMTKGEMFTRAAQIIGEDEASQLLSMTHSCGLTGQRAFKISMAIQCGVCFGCLIRRASFHASGLQDRTVYIEHGADTKLENWLDKVSVEQPMRNLIERGIRARDVLALGLPPEYAVNDALDLSHRGISELKDYLS